MSSPKPRPDSGPRSSTEAAVDTAIAARFETQAPWTPYVVATVGPPPEDDPDWVSFRTATSPAYLDAMVSAVADLDGAPRNVAGGFVAEAVVAVLMVPLTSALYGHRVVVLPDPDRLWVHRSGPAGFDRLRMAGVRLLAADDLEAPDLSDGVERLPLHELRVRFGAHAVAALHDPVTVLQQVGRRGLRPMWQTAADTIAATFLDVGQHLGDPAGARDACAETLAAAPKPLRHKVTWLQIPDVPAPYLTKRRVGCCLAYKARAYLGEYCTTCSLIPVEETVARLVEHRASLSPDVDPASLTFASEPNVDNT
jgi:hypothetical protein